MILLYFLSLFFYLYSVRGQSDCRVEGLSRYDFSSYTNPVTISDTHEGQVAFFIVEDITDVFIKDVQYLNVSLTSNRVSIFTTEEYQKVEEQESHQDFPKISAEIVFECANGSSIMSFNQRIDDANNHDPYFSKELYVFTFGMDISSGVTLTAFRNVIATDIDLSNALVEFSVEENDYIRIRNGASASNSKLKSAYATIETTRDIKLPFEREFTIIVTDSESPVRNGTAVVKILLIAPINITPNLVFSKPLYIGHYGEDVLALEEEIVLSHGSGYNLIVSQLGYEDYFEVEVLDEDEGVLGVKTVNTLPQEVYQNKKHISFEIEVRSYETVSFGRCTILIVFFE